MFLQILLVALYVTTAYCQNASIPTGTTQHNPKEFPYLFRVHYSVNEDKVSKLIQHEIMTTPKENLEQVMSVQDLMGLVKIDQITLAQTGNVIDKLHLKNHVNLMGMKHVLESLNLSISTLYVNFSTRFVKDQFTQVPPILEVFQLNSTFFESVFQKNDTKLYEVLAQGVYSHEKFDRVFKMLNVSKEEVFDFFKPTFLQALKNVSMADLRQCFMSWNKPDAISDLIHAFNVTLEDIMISNKTMDLITDFQEKIEAIELLGVRIGSQKIVSHRLSHQNREYYKDFVSLFGESLDLSTRVNVDDSHMSRNGNDYACLETEAMNGTVMMVASVYNTTILKNCSYITGDTLLVYKENVPQVINYQDTLVMTKTNGTVFRRGSPMICNNLLYGLANFEDSEEIVFSTFLALAGGSWIRASVLNVVGLVCLVQLVKNF